MVVLGLVSQSEPKAALPADLETSRIDLRPYSALNSRRYFIGTDKADHHVVLHYPAAAYVSGAEIFLSSRMLLSLFS